VAARVAVVILALVLVAGGLLELRRQRFQAAHELAEAQRRIRAVDEDVLRLRAELARRAAEIGAEPPAEPHADAAGADVPWRPAHDTRG